MDALCGGTVSLHTLDGRALAIPLTEVVGPRSEKVVPGEGMPVAKAPGTRGNLRVRFEIDFPSRLDDLQRIALHQLLSQTPPQQQQQQPHQQPPQQQPPAQRTGYAY